MLLRDHFRFYRLPRADVLQVRPDELDKLTYSGQLKLIAESHGYGPVEVNIPDQENHPGRRPFYEISSDPVNIKLMTDLLDSRGHMRETW